MRTPGSSLSRTPSLTHALLRPPPAPHTPTHHTHTTRRPYTSHTHSLTAVPHVFRFSTGHEARPFAYTADSDSNVETDGPGGEPAPPPTVAIAFSFSPLAVTLAEARRAAWQWAISLAAILGGVLAGVNLLDGLLHGVAAGLKKNA